MEREYGNIVPATDCQFFASAVSNEHNHLTSFDVSTFFSDSGVDVVQEISNERFCVLFKKMFSYYGSHSDRCTQMKRQEAERTSVYPAVTVRRRQHGNELSHR